jgi:protein-S-isoprenylcysteine O-methyltransferase Ste14
MDLRQILFKYRSYTPIPFLVVMILIARPTVVSFILGIVLVILGELTRLWGVSYAGSETRTTGTVGATYLVTSGPFSHVRNPLYLGNMIMYFGFGIISNSLVLASIGLLYFLFQYSLIVSLEEESLFKKFLDEYVEYYSEVPRFIPRIKKYKSEASHQIEIDWKKGIKSEKRTLQAIFLVIILLGIIWHLRS